MAYTLLVIKGQTEPSLVGDDAPNWESFERKVVEFLQSEEWAYDSFEDGIFWIETDAKGRLKSVHPFTAEFMEEMQYRARSPKAWRPKRKR